MKRTFFALAAGMAALMGANQPTTTTAPDTAQHKAGATTSTPAKRVPQTDSTQPMAQATQPRTIRPRPMALGGPVYYPAKPGLRKVKYGKSRWIILS
ncbi:hypothetical protein [Hymenobacter negativus]|uniref:Uncharacterized protein n=1 Tax=Hymenobacter negativus TaxID=2795026 RepID=A0ABS0QB24_9BACT|nr:hypothetical protein [Hymenobacter negativus]MBH8559865.1 hypothetical protein [Hymenobacter negativus]